MTKASLNAATPSNSSFDVEAGQDKSCTSMERSANPFAERQKGKTLAWKDIKMTVRGKRNEADQMILDNVWGEAPAQQTTAIMGPSGAGKTSLLNVLAGRSTSGGRVSIDADIRLDNVSVDPADISARQNIAFVAQDDSLQVTSTPREAIHFSAKLRLPRSTTNEQLEQLTTRILEELGLTSCADTIVGGPLIKGISGGERKRTSVGVELVSQPSMIFLDEPTSGLDSYSAVQLCDVLKKVANAGASVLFTIHQPSSDIFASFDNLILMKQGRVMYQESVTNVPSYFSERGYPCPPNYNPADWLMNIAQANTDEALHKAGFFPQNDRILCDASGREDISVGNEKSVGGRCLPFCATTNRMVVRESLPPSFWTKTKMLFLREVMNVRRDKSTVAVRFGTTVLLSLVLGAVFFGVGRSDPTVPQNLQSQFGGIMNIMLFAMIGTAMQALALFPQERPVFLREYSTNHYSVASYFCSKLSAEIVLTGIQMVILSVISYYMMGLQSNLGLYFAVTYMLAMTSTATAVLFGCSLENEKMASELLSLVFLPQVLFSGFYVSIDLIPVWLRWLQWLSPLTYANRILVVDEFYDCGDRRGIGGTAATAANENCDALIRSVGANPNDVWWYWIVLFCLFCAFRMVALFNLKRNASKFL